MEAPQGEEIYRDQARKEFQRRVRDLDSELSKVQQPVTLGPLYHVSTSQGEPLAVYTLFIDHTQSKDQLTPDEGDNKFLYMIAYDETGDMVGLTKTILLSVNQGLLKGFDDVATFPRGRGIASSIELVHDDLSQRIANNTGRNLEYELTNANLTGLDSLKAKPQQDGELIAAKEQEQLRWKRLYGPGGTLGYDANGKKRFAAHEQEAATPLDSIDTIALGRVVSSDNGREVVRGEVQDMSTMDVTQLSRVRQQRLSQNIRPSIQRVLKAA